MGTTGLIYVAIVAAWAAYLVPMLLKRNDEASRRRSAEKYSSSDARVLSRADGSRARYVVRPAGTAAGTSGVAGAGGSAGGPSGSGGASGADGAADAKPPPARYVPNRARRVAAMRRRRVLSILTLSLLSVVALAGLEILLWWSVAIPAGLIVFFVVLTRIQLRRQARDRAALTAERRARAESRHDRGPSAAPSSPDNEMTVEVKLPSAAAESAAETKQVAPTSSEALWDPVPVTLPTYVLKEKAPDRTVRTINLSGPEVFSSARLPEPDADTAPPTPAEPTEAPVEPEIRRAVGD